MTGHDPPSALFIKRCEEFRFSPPVGEDDGDWDGVYRPKSK
jgi:hypothetical protein